MTDAKHDKYFTGDPYLMWRERLQGKEVSISPRYANTAFCGRWKMQRERGAGSDRLAVWQDGHADGYYRRFNNERVFFSTNLPEINGFAYATPVTEAEYEAHAATGVWPGEVPGLIRNSKDISDAVQLLENLLETVNRAAVWLDSHKDITTQEDCDTAANFRTSISALSKQAAAKHKEELTPLKKAVTDCNSKWESGSDKVSKVSDGLRTVAERFLIRQKEDNDRKAALAQQAIDAERKAIEDIDITLAALIPVKKVAPAKVGAGGQVGRKMGLRTVHSGEITDYDKVLAHFSRHAKVVELIDSLVQAEARSKDRRELPGVTYKQASKAI